nr:hypothetical protein BaRGS_018477 [Batillaria attramentaria]
MIRAWLGRGPMIKLEGKRRPGNYGTCGAGRVIIHIKDVSYQGNHPCEVSESRLCGNSLLIGSIAHPPWAETDLGVLSSRGR